MKLNRCRFLLLPILGGHAVAAGLNQGEWFLDQEPGVGAGTPFAAAAMSSVGIPANVIDALAPGAHLLGIRFRDLDGDWGQTVWRTFYREDAPEVPATLATGEWFLNVDPGAGNGTGFGMTAETTTVILTSGQLAALGEGVHLLGIRFKDSHERWGHPVWRAFYRLEQISPAPQILSLEYRIAIGGNVVASNSQNATSPASLVDFRVRHGKGSLQLGSPHVLQVIPVDATGRKGIPQSVDFTYLTYNDAWTETHFDEFERQDPEISGPDADPDEDGLPNAAEKLFALNPRDGSDGAKAAARITKSESGITLSFRVPDGGSVGSDGIYRTSNLNYNLQTGETPSATVATPALWFTGWTLQTSEPGGATLDISLQPPPAEKRFFRLQGNNP